MVAQVVGWHWQLTVKWWLLQLRNKMPRSKVKWKTGTLQIQFIAKFQSSRGSFYWQTIYSKSARIITAGVSNCATRYIWREIQDSPLQTWTWSEGTSWSPVAKAIWKYIQINYKENFGTKRDVILFSLSLMLLYWIQKDLKILSTLTTLEASAKSSVRSPGQACYHLILLFHSVGIRIGRHLGLNSTLSRFDHIDTRILLSFDKYIKYLYNLHWYEAPHGELQACHLAGQQRSHCPRHYRAHPAIP